MKRFRGMDFAIVFLLGCIIGAGGIYLKNIQEMKKVAQQKLIAGWQQPISLPDASGQKDPVQKSAAVPPEKQPRPAARPRKPEVRKSVKTPAPAVRPAVKPVIRQPVSNPELEKKIYDLFVFQPLMQELLNRGDDLFHGITHGVKHVEFARRCNRFTGTARKLEMLVKKGEIRAPGFKDICARLAVVEEALNLAWENRECLNVKSPYMAPYLSEEYILIQFGGIGLYNSPTTRQEITPFTEESTCMEMLEEAQAHRTASKIMHFFLFGTGRKYCVLETFRKNGKDYRVCHFRQHLIVIQNRANQAQNIYMVRYDSVADLLAVAQKEYEPVRAALKRYIR